MVIPRPNTNSYMDGTVKKYISGSETPEAHVLFVWDNIICKTDNIERVVLLGYGGGASLCKDILQRHLASPAKANVVAILTMNASLFFENDDTIMTKDVLGKISANLECASPPLGSRLNYRKIKLGCETFSVGLPPGYDVTKSMINGIVACILMCTHVIIHTYSTYVCTLLKAPPMLFTHTYTYLFFFYSFRMSARRLCHPFVRGTCERISESKS